MASTTVLARRVTILGVMTLAGCLTDILDRAPSWTPWVGRAEPSDAKGGDRSADASLLPARDLRVEHADRPLGVGTTVPRLSWRLVARRRAARQSAYRILVATDPEALAEGRGDIWDSGRVESDRCVNVEYEGPPPTSGRRYWWKVEVRDEAGRPSGFSEPSWWEMAPLGSEGWGSARWIGAGVAPGPRSETEEDWLPECGWLWHPGEPRQKAVVLRRGFFLGPGRAIEAASLRVHAPGRYEVCLNGESLGASQRPRDIDVRASLRSGRNVLALRAERDDGPGGAIFALRVTFRDGDPLSVTSDARTRSSPSSRADWASVALDDDAWGAAEVVAGYGSPPFGKVGLLPRSPAVYLRRELVLPSSAVRARIHVSGLGYYELHVNGERMGDQVLAPALTDYDRRVLFETHDATDALRPGSNAITLTLGPGRYQAPRILTPIPTRTWGEPRAILRLVADLADGRRIELSSDEEWRSGPGPIVDANDYDGEVYDARLEVDGWQESGFDGAGWRPARLLSAPKGSLRPQTIDPIRVTERIAPVSITEPAPGVHVVDFGENLVGWVRMQVRGPRSTRVRLGFAEVLGDDGRIDTANLRSARARCVYVLRGEGLETYEPRFSYFGFRYVEVTGYPGRPGPEAFEARFVHSAVRPVGRFRSSSDLLNRLRGNLRRGIRGNLRGIPTDCPQRDERQGWLGDIAVESLGESYEFDMARFFTKWLDDIRDAQREDGSLPDVVPDYWVIETGDVTWPSAYPIILDWMSRHYDDSRLLAVHYPHVKRWVDSIRGSLRDGVLPAERDHYGDWCVPPESPELIHSRDPTRKTPGDLLATAYYHHDLTLLARFARQLDHAEDAEEYEELAARVRRGFLDRFFDPARARFDGGTQTSSILPLAFGLAPEEHREAVADGLARSIRETSGGHVGTGLIGGQWLMRTLTDCGHADLAYALATRRTYPSWGYMVEQGATTLWELWNGDTAAPEMNSRNHLMLAGDLGVWLYARLAGIRCGERARGFRHVVIRPIPSGDLTFVEASVDTVRGRVASRWRLTPDGGILLEVEVPAGSEATIGVPRRGIASPSVTESGLDVWSANAFVPGVAGVASARSEEDAIAFEVGSGSYRFELRP